MTGDVNYNEKHKVSAYQILMLIICCGIIVMMIISSVLLYKSIKINKELKSYYAQYENSEEGKYIVSTLSEIRELSEKYQLDGETDFQLCADNAIAYYVRSMDDKYAYYTSPKDTTIEDLADSGKGVGLGVSIVYVPGIGAYVVDIYENSAAAEYGIKIGDYITGVNGYSILDNYSIFLEKLKGNAGEVRNISLNRNDEELEVQVKLREYEIHYVTSEVIDDTAIVKIKDFTKTTDNEFIDIMEMYRLQGIKNYVFDIRNNTGGHLEVVENMLDYLLPAGLIVQIKDKNGELEHEFFSDEKEFKGNFVVITNGYTSSASELFAQSLRDFDRAEIVGTKTYGKGTVLSVFRLNSGGTVTLSTGLYVTNSGKFLEDDGIEPDYELEIDLLDKETMYELSIDEDNQIQKALEVIHGI